MAVHDRRFDIVFSGQTVEGAGLVAVQERLAILFKMDRSTVASLFSGRRYTIKKNLDGPTAGQYKAALEKAGAVCEIVERRDAAAITIAPPGTILAEQQAPHPPAIDISALAMLEVGMDVLDDYPQPRTPAMDVSAISMAPAGEILVVPSVEEVPPPSVGQFSLAEVGAWLCEGAAIQPAPDVAASAHLTLAPAGADLGDASEQQSS